MQPAVISIWNNILQVSHRQVLYSFVWDSVAQLRSKLSAVPVIAVNFIAQRREISEPPGARAVMAGPGTTMAEDIFSELPELPLEVPAKREVCSRCR